MEKRCKQLSIKLFSTTQTSSYLADAIIPHFWVYGAELFTVSRKRSAATYSRFSDVSSRTEDNRTRSNHHRIGAGGRITLLRRSSFFPSTAHDERYSGGIFNRMIQNR